MAHRCVSRLCSWREPTGGTPHRQTVALVPVAKAEPNRLVHWCPWRTPHPTDGCTGARGASHTQRLSHWCPWRTSHPPDGCAGACGASCAQLTIALAPVETSGPSS
eukprot:6124535-Alexandrium_andersonii.AAC.1